MLTVSGRPQRVAVQQGTGELQFSRDCASQVMSKCHGVLPLAKPGPTEDN